MRFPWESKISAIQQIKTKQGSYQVIHGFRKTNKIHANIFCFCLECNELLQCNTVLDPSSSITTKTVMGLLESGNLLVMHRQIWFNNWFNSVKLLLEMLSRDTYGAGKVRTNRKDRPKAVVGKSVKLKHFENVC